MTEHDDFRGPGAPAAPGSPGASAVPGTRGTAAGTRRFRTHRFEPTRFVLGTALLVAASAYVLDVADPWPLPRWLQVTMVPLALLLGGATALVTSVARRLRARGRDGG